MLKEAKQSAAAAYVALQYSNPCKAAWVLINYARPKRVLKALILPQQINLISLQLDSVVKNVENKKSVYNSDSNDTEEFPLILSRFQWREISSKNVLNTVYKLKYSKSKDIIGVST